MRASITSYRAAGRRWARGPLGDFVDADLGELEYLPPPTGRRRCLGKTLPVFGIEYKDKKRPALRHHPSLVARHTVGSQLGIKMRSAARRLADPAASVTNNSSTIEMFHFYRRSTGTTTSSTARRGQHPGRPALSIGGPPR
jgi:hypothetical protein